MYVKSQQNRSEMEIRQSKKLKKKRKVISKRNRVRAEKLKKREAKEKPGDLGADAEDSRPDSVTAVSVKESEFHQPKRNRESKERKRKSTKKQKDSSA